MFLIKIPWTRGWDKVLSRAWGVQHSYFLNKVESSTVNLLQLPEREVVRTSLKPDGSLGVAEPTHAIDEGEFQAQFSPFSEQRQTLATGH